MFAGGEGRVAIYLIEDYMRLFHVRNFVEISSEFIYSHRTIFYDQYTFVYFPVLFLRMEKIWEKRSRKLVDGWQTLGEKRLSTDPRCETQIVRLLKSYLSMGREKKKKKKKGGRKLGQNLHTFNSSKFRVRLFPSYSRWWVLERATFPLCIPSMHMRAFTHSREIIKTTGRIKFLSAC